MANPHFAKFSFSIFINWRINGKAMIVGSNFYFASFTI
jgi:hypothetical protein